MRKTYHTPLVSPGQGRNQDDADKGAALICGVAIGSLALLCVVFLYIIAKLV